MIHRLAGAALLLLSACSGQSASHFYTLAPMAPGGTPSARPGLIVTVGQVMLPPALDRNSFVRRVGPEQLEMSGQDRWAAPLDGIVRRVLAADLASRMPGADVIAPGDPMPSGHVLTVDVNLRQFIGDANGQVILDADWSVRGSAKTHPISLTRQAGSGKADAIAAAMSALLADLSDHIAAALASRAASA